MRAVGVVRVTPEDIGRRVSIRRRIGALDGAPGTSDVVGTLLTHDGHHLLVERRSGGRVRVRQQDLVAARVVPARPAAALELDAARAAARDAPPVREDLQLCLNGARRSDEHPAVPVDAQGLEADARDAAALGVRLLHVHARDGTGEESLAPSAVEAAVRALRAGAPGCQVSVSTGAWIEGDPARRAGLVARWEELPDVASVNLAEDGAVELAGLLSRIGVGVEAGLSSSGELEVLATSGLLERCARVLVEPLDEDPEAAVALAAQLDAGLPPGIPRLVHGQGASAWPVLRWAAGRGALVRIGLEDVLVGPEGGPAEGNAALVRAAVSVLDGAQHGSTGRP